MSQNAFQAARVIAIEEHARNPGLREALFKFGRDDTITANSATGPAFTVTQSLFPAGG